MNFESNWANTIVCISPTRFHKQCAKVWPSPLTPWPQINRVPPLNYQQLSSDRAKIEACVVPQWKRDWDTDILTQTPRHPITHPNNKLTAALLYTLQCSCEGMTFMVAVKLNCTKLAILNTWMEFTKIVAAFRGMHVSPAKHSLGKCDRQMDGRTVGRGRNGQTDRRTDRRTTDKVIPMCHCASQATQKVDICFHISKLSVGS